MRLYLAACYSARAHLLERVALPLERVGFQITASWLWRPPSPTLGGDALTDLADLRNSDALALFTYWNGGKGGKDAEFGMAMALGLHLYLVGPTTHVFTHAPGVNRYKTPENFVLALSDLALSGQPW